MKNAPRKQEVIVWTVMKDLHLGWRQELSWLGRAIEHRSYSHASLCDTAMHTATPPSHPTTVSICCWILSHFQYTQPSRAILNMMVLVLWHLTLPYLTFEVDATRGSIQRSGHQVGPLHVLIKPKAIRISQKLLQTSGVRAIVCYITR